MILATGGTIVVFNSSETSAPIEFGAVRVYPVVTLATLDRIESGVPDIGAADSASKHP